MTDKLVWAAENEAESNDMVQITAVWHKIMMLVYEGSLMINFNESNESYYSQNGLIADVLTFRRE